jgi:DNA-binding NtrC family response regulator
VVLCTGHVIGESDFQAEIRSAAQAPSGPAPGSSSIDETLPLAEAVEQFKRGLIRRALEKAQGNQAEAAGILGLQRSNLSRLMKALHLR